MVSSSCPSARPFKRTDGETSWQHDEGEKRLKRIFSTILISFSIYFSLNWSYVAKAAMVMKDELSFSSYIFFFPSSAYSLNILERILAEPYFVRSKHLQIIKGKTSATSSWYHSFLFFLIFYFSINHLKMVSFSWSTVFTNWTLLWMRHRLTPFDSPSLGTFHPVHLISTPSHRRRGNYNCFEAPFTHSTQSDAEMKFSRIYKMKFPAINSTIWKVIQPHCHRREREENRKSSLFHH